MDRASDLNGMSARLSDRSPEHPPVLRRRGARVRAEVVAQVGGAAHPDAVGDRLHRQRRGLEQPLGRDHALSDEPAGGRIADLREKSAAEGPFGHSRASRQPSNRDRLAKVPQRPSGSNFTRGKRSAKSRAKRQWVVRLASLGRPVKKMIGGVTGWIDEGFPLTAGP